MGTIITTIEVKPLVTGKGVPFWSVKSLEGDFTVWDKVIAENLLGNLNKRVDVDVKVSGQYNNIRGINAILDLATPRQMVAAAPVIPAVTTPVIPQAKPTTSFNDDKQKSIIAQCLTKAACENNSPIEDVVAMYHKALTLI